MKVINTGQCSECHMESQVVLIGDESRSALICFECIDRLVSIPEVFRYRFPNSRGTKKTTIELRDQYPPFGLPED